MSELSYPDNGQLLEDASILRNAIEFSTGQRAFVAYNVIRQPLEHLNADALASFAVEAFMLEMTSTEDLLGWLFVLKKWKPGDLSYSLWPLLHKVQIGSGPYSEEKAGELLSTLDPIGLRRLLHVPSDEELSAKSGLPESARKRIDQAMTAGLDGLKTLVAYRQEGERLRVRAFNKLKHHLVAIPTDDGVLVPVWEGLERNPGYVSAATLTIGTKPNDIRLLAGRAIIAQATLNSWLGIILMVRYGKPFENPTWAVNALRLQGWKEPSP